MFYRSLSRIEQAHVVEAFTFELGKCFEQAIKERELLVLAQVDADLCAQVAAGLGLPAPNGEPAESVLRLARAVADAGRARADRRRVVGVIADAGVGPRRHRQARAALWRSRGDAAA